MRSNGPPSAVLTSGTSVKPCLRGGCGIYYLGSWEAWAEVFVHRALSVDCVSKEEIHPWRMGSSVHEERLIDSSDRKLGRHHSFMHQFAGVKGEANRESAVRKREDRSAHSLKRGDRV